MTLPKGIKMMFLCNFIKKRLQHRCFPVNIAKFLKPILKNIYERLLLPFRNYEAKKMSKKIGEKNLMV